MTALKEKILHITWQMSIGGLERAVYQLIRAQRNIGIEADLMVLSSSSFYGEMVQKSGARVYELGQKSGLDLSIKKKFLQAIESYTLLHFHTASPILMHIACSANCKLYYTHRGGWHPLSLKRLLMYKITGYYLKKHFCVSANTRHAASIASRLYNIAREQIYTTYNGIDFALLQPRQVKKRCKDKVYIGTSANLRSWKRIDYLLQAIAKIKSVPIKCYIIGTLFILAMACNK